MATLTKTGGTGTTGHVAGNAVAKVYVQTTVIDGTSTALTSGDVYQAINIPANSVVLNAGIDKITAGTGTGTLALGDGTVTYVAAAVQTAAGAMTSGDAVAEMFASYPEHSNSIRTARPGGLANRIHFECFVLAPSVRLQKSR